MKKILPLCLIVFILLGYMFPVQPVKADQGTEVTYTDSQLSQIGAWALANNLIRGITDSYDFSNISARAPMTPADFLIALGESIVTGNPAPLVEFGYNVAEDVVDELTSDLQDLWDSAKDFFYELFFGSPTDISIDEFIGVSTQIGLDGIDGVLKSVDSDSPIVNPDPNYANLLNSINGNEAWQFFWKHFDTFFDGYVNNASNPYFITPVPSISYIATSYYSTPIVPSNYKTKVIATCDLTSIYINGSNDSYSFSTNFISRPYISIDSSKYGNAYCNQFKLDSFYLYIEQTQQDSNFSYTYNIYRNNETLQSCLEYISQYCRNVNIYVNGDPWSIAYVEPPNPVSSGYLTYPNGEPAVREFPTGTQIDWNELYNRIYQAIVDGLVLDFSDIDDCIVDVNGQSAVASLRLVRTDYDKLYLEQYANDINLPFFPATLTTGEAQAVVGGTVGHIISPYNPSNPALNEDSVIPSDIARILYVGVFLTLFACVINRLLE